MIELLLDAILDSLIVFITVLIIYFILSFIEEKLAVFIEKRNGFSPLMGSALGLIPQCGFSIVGSDLYLKHKISMGTIIAIFISCSDEAIPIIISSPNNYKFLILLLVIKFVVAIIFGLIIDLIFNKQVIEPYSDAHIIHKGCCHHEIDNKEKENHLKTHLLHPLIHSLKIFVYILIINVLFAILLYFVSENTIKEFLISNSYLSVLLSSLVGLIPNCASSVIISELFISGSLPFASLVSGLICNAGLGLIYLYKDKSNLKNALIITLLLFVISLIVGYSILIII